MLWKKRKAYTTRNSQIWYFDFSPHFLRRSNNSAWISQCTTQRSAIKDRWTRFSERRRAIRIPRKESANCSKSSSIRCTYLRIWSCSTEILWAPFALPTKRPADLLAWWWWNLRWSHSFCYWLGQTLRWY